MVLSVSASHAPSGMCLYYSNPVGLKSIQLVSCPHVAALALGAAAQGREAMAGLSLGPGTWAPCPPGGTPWELGEGQGRSSRGTHRSRVRTSSSCSPGEGRRVSGPILQSLYLLTPSPGPQHPETSVRWEGPCHSHRAPGQEAQRETSRGTLVVTVQGSLSPLDRGQEPASHREPPRLRLGVPRPLSTKGAAGVGGQAAFRARNGAFLRAWAVVGGRGAGHPPGGTQAGG